MSIFVLKYIISIPQNAFKIQMEMSENFRFKSYIFLHFLDLTTEAIHIMHLKACGSPDNPTKAVADHLTLSD